MIETAVRFLLSVQGVCEDLKSNIVKKRIIQKSEVFSKMEDIKAAIRVFPLRQNTELCRIFSSTLNMPLEEYSYYLSEKPLDELQM